MATLYLIVLTALGGFLALFGAAGLSSYKDKKLPATPMLFRWFVAGALSAGLGAYAWLFGAGGDPTTILEKLGESFEVKEVMETLNSAVGSAAAGAAESVAEAADAASEMTVGLPRF
jgi:hypothetical protein